MENMPNQNPSGITPPPGGGMNNMESQEKSMGPLIGSVIIIVILVVGGLYLWSTKMQEIEEPIEIMQNQGIPANQEQKGVMMQDEATAALGAQGSSDEIGNIEADINTTNLNDIDAEMGTI